MTVLDSGEDTLEVTFFGFSHLVSGVNKNPFVSDRQTYGTHTIGSFKIFWFQNAAYWPIDGFRFFWTNIHPCLVLKEVSPLTFRKTVTAMGGVVDTWQSYSPLKL